ncbi:MAG: hypothetical protein ACLSTI_01345 [Ruminococcus sp.]|nr:hypothetical protein [Ruminococcus sp.]
MGKEMHEERSFHQNWIGNHEKYSTNRMSCQAMKPFEYRRRRTAVKLAQLGEGCRGQAAPCIEVHDEL